MLDQSKEFKTYPALENNYNYVPVSLKGVLIGQNVNKKDHIGTLNKELFRLVLTLAILYRKNASLYLMNC